MFKAVLALATVMVASGGFAIFNGMGMILNERGWTQVIGGCVVLSTGLLILSLAALLAHARTLFAVGGQAVEPQIAPEQPVRPVDPVFAVPSDHVHPQAYEADIHHGASHHEASHHETSHLETSHLETGHHETGLHETGHHDLPPVASAHAGHGAAPEPIAAFAETFERDYPASVSAYKPARHQDGYEPSAHDLLTDLVPPPVPMPVAKPDEWSLTTAARQDNPPSQPSLLDSLTQAAPYHASYEPVRPTMPPAHTIERELVASYTAGGVGYFMYSDQTIEAEMAIGRYRFASMDELRHFVETNEGGVKVGESTQI